MSPFALFVLAFSPLLCAQADDWSQAEANGRQSQRAVQFCHRYAHGWLGHADAKTGLLPRTLKGDGYWNARDCAADNYPFLALTARMTGDFYLQQAAAFILEQETKLACRLDRLPDDFLFATQKFRTEQYKLPDLIFGAAEYAKDGLMPMTEWLGPGPWLDRMQGLVQDVLKHAALDSPVGKLPSGNVEVIGDLLQVTSRLYWATGDEDYRSWAFRMADFYLLHHDLLAGDNLRLRDHGCEIIGGLGLLFAVDVQACPDKAKQYQPHLEYLFDEILQRGTNSDGVIVGELQATPGLHDSVVTRDGWGYDFVGFLDYDLALGTDRYGQAIRRPLTNLLKPRYLRFNWDHGSRDNVADSVEGGLYLLRRFPVPEAFVWADREIATLLVDHADPNRLWGVHKLEANTVRTVLIHTMLHTRNTLVRPWQQGLQVGAAPCGDGICVFLKCDAAYEGRLQFDVPRHRLTFGFQQDWPRMNAVPEWFTVEPDESHRYEVRDVDAAPAQVVSGKSLRDGWPVRLEAGQPLRLVVRPL